MLQAEHIKLISRGCRWPKLGSPIRQRQYSIEPSAGPIRAGCRQGSDFDFEIGSRRGRSGPAKTFALVQEELRRQAADGAVRLILPATTGLPSASLRFSLALYRGAAYRSDDWP